MKVYTVLVTVIAVLSSAGFGILFFSGNYCAKILVKFGLKERMAERNWAVFSWTNTMEKLDYEADIVFFGDSITRGSDFRKYYPSKRIINLGYSGDSVVGMTERVSQIKAVAPKKVFVLGGINGLTVFNMERSVSQYAKLLDRMKHELPNTEIIVQSVLPISAEKETFFRRNSTILSFNTRIEKLAEDRRMPYMDINTLYQKDGAMNPELTVDGIHLHPEAYGLWADALRGYID